MHGVYEAGLAVNCISNIVTEELAKDLLLEITNLTNHSQPYLRKKAILCLFKVFVKYPQGLRLTFDNIQKSLQDSDASVVSCAVNVITELSDKNPKNYLHLAPAFFDLLTNSSNNWMLIKVVKLLGSLVPEEPRLARKLLEPLAKIVRTTQAKSLLFEAVHTVTLCLPYSRKSDGTMPAIVSEIVVLCAQTLRDFVEQHDQNLKYLGLVGFASLMQSHPKVLSAPDYRPLILACLSDQDVTIRSRALELLKGMASRKNLIDLVAQLLKHVEMASGSYKQDLVAKIVEMCSSDKYALLADFEWYLDVLFQIGHMRGIEKHGDLLRAQIIDVALRVLPVRPFAVRRAIEILMEGDGSVSDDPYGDNGRGKRIIPAVLPALAWIVGEYSDFIADVLQKEDLAVFFDDESAGSYHSIIQVFSSPFQVQKYVHETQKVFIQASMKVLAVASVDKKTSAKELEACVRSLERGLSVFIQSTNVEVMERAFTALEMLKGLGIKTGNSTCTPGLTDAEDESEDDEDLLGMNRTSSALAPTKSPRKESLAALIRDSSSYLSYVLKPAPMKPIGSKVQRKKNESIGLPETIDLTVFEKMIDDEIDYRGRVKLSSELVCFTQQKTLSVDSHLSFNASHFEQVTVTSAANFNEAPSSFQKAANNFTSTNVPRQRQSDPFYLDTVPSVGGETFRQDNTFGAIQLGDSDDDSTKDEKMKKKKAKKEKKEKRPYPLSYFDTATSSMFEPSKTTMEIYSSDDDDNEGQNTANRRKGPGKEFAGLAQIDLTTPLRDDEIMPERKHHVVADRSHTDQPTSFKAKKEIKKKDKKARKKKVDSTESKSGIGDLLDLGVGFDSHNQAEIAHEQTQNANPISSAFDDLLGISANSMQELPTQMNKEVPSVHDIASQHWSMQHTTVVHTWMRATVKSSSSSSINWSAISLNYRVEQSSGGLMVVMMIENNSLMSLSNVDITMKGYQPVSVESILPGSRNELRLGPFTSPPRDESQDVKGHFQTQNEKASIKLVLPSFIHCGPEVGITLDEVAVELASPGWTNNTCRIPHSNTLPATSLKATLAGALNAFVVDGNDSLSGTLACRSSSGARVRILFKIKESSVKLDIKSTSSALGEALATDLKRLAL